MDTFKLCMPLDLIKSEDGEDREMRIGGYASTADPDRQGEVVTQKNLDISEFVSSGFFNLDHDNSKILGYPDGDRCGIDSRGLYVEGILLKGVPEAESLYRTALALQKSNAPRRLGFSVEGQVLGRNGNGLITRAKVYNVAITSQPINTQCTWEALCKSFAAAGSDDIEKALDTGNYAQLQGPAVQNGGAALTRESLETAFRNLADIIGQNEEASALMDALKEILRQKGHLSKSEGALYLALTRELPLRKSLALVRDVWDRRNIV